jgi:hypothetical protein
MTSREPGSRFAGTRSEKIGVGAQARRQSKKYRPLSSLSGAAKNALKKKMHKKRPRGVSEDLMKIVDRKSQEKQTGGKMRRGAY